MRRLVELHGGTVRASNHDPGAAFEVRLQLAGTRADLPAHAGDAAGLDHALSGLRVLLVEDDADSREALALMLSGHGASIDEAGTCQEAWARFEASPPDVLISDIGLPDGDGYELIGRVRGRSRAGGGEVPAIALTAYGGREDARRAVQSGYQAHVVKPFDLPALVRTIQALAGRTTC